MLRERTASNGAQVNALHLDDAKIHSCQGDAAAWKKSAIERLVTRMRAAMELRGVDAKTLKDYLVPPSTADPEVLSYPRRGGERMQEKILIKPGASYAFVDVVTVWRAPTSHLALVYRTPGARCPVENGPVRDRGYKRRGECARERSVGGSIISSNVGDLLASTDPGTFLLRRIWEQPGAVAASRRPDNLLPLPACAEISNLSTYRNNQKLGSLQESREVKREWRSFLSYSLLRAAASRRNSSSCTDEYTSVSLILVICTHEHAALNNGCGCVSCHVDKDSCGSLCLKWVYHSRASVPSYGAGRCSRRSHLTWICTFLRATNRFVDFGRTFRSPCGRCRHSRHSYPNRLEKFVAVYPTSQADLLP